MPVRVGMPKKVGGLKGEVQDPIHSTGVGLLLYGAAQSAYGSTQTYSHSNSDNMWERMKNWFNGNL